MTGNAHSVSTESEEGTSSKNNISHRISRESVKNRCSDLIDSLSIIVYVCEPHPPYTTLYVSKGIETFGYTQDDLYNAPDFWIKILHKEDRERILRNTENAFSEKKTINHEYRIYARDGSICWLHGNAHFVYDVNGEPVSYEGFLLDITERKLSELNVGNTTEADDKSSAENKKNKILLVEDEKIIRELMCEILLTDGYDVTTAENGIEALEICETGEKKFDLLITDFEMPQMNGRELAEKLKVSCCATKILFVSGYAGDDEFFRNLSRDGKYFVAKPFSPDSFTEKVKTVLKED